MGVCIGCDHSGSMDLLGTVHQNLQRMHLQMLRVKLSVEPLQFLQCLLCLMRIGEHIATVDIDWQTVLQIHLAELLIDALVDLLMLREASVKEASHTSFHAIVNQTGERSFNLLIIQFYTIEEERPRGRFKRVSSHVSVFAHKITESWYRIHRIIVDAVVLKHFGVHPVAVAFAFQKHQFAVRTDGVQVLLGESLSVQVFLLHHETVTRQTGILSDIVCHERQGALFPVTLKAYAQISVLESDTGGHMHMAVDDPRHDEFPTEVSDFSLIY